MAAIKGANLKLEIQSEIVEIHIMKIQIYLVTNLSPSN